MLAINPSKATIEQIQELIKFGNSNQLDSMIYRIGESVQEFKERVKDPETGGKELKTGLVNTEVANQFCQTELATQIFSSLTTKALDFILEVSEQLHPGHDLRHLLFKDSIAAIRILENTKIEPYQQTAFIAGLLHDSGRALEILMQGKIAGGVEGDKHTEYSYLIMKTAMNSVREEFSLELSNNDRKILDQVFDELLNAVLDHQTGNSKKSVIAQVVQSADRLQLVGFEMAMRAIAFDVGIQGAVILPGLNEDHHYALPFPGKSTGVNYNLIEHMEFYARHLFPNYGEFAEKETAKLKSQTIRFISECLLDDCSPEVVKSMLEGPLEKINPYFLQTFFPEIIEYRQNYSLELPEYQIDRLGKFPKAQFSQEIFLDAFNVEKNVRLEGSDFETYNKNANGLSLDHVLGTALTLPYSYPCDKFQTNSGETALDRIISETNKLNVSELGRFRKALNLMNFMNQASDVRDFAMLGTLTENNAVNPMVRVYAEMITEVD